MFETRSLIIVTALTLLVTALAIALSWFVNRRIRGAHYWSLGYFLLTGGVVLQSFQTSITHILSVGLANLLFTFGMYFTYLGVSFFHGRSLRYWRQLFLLVFVVVAVHIVVGVEKEGFLARTLLISGLLGAVSYLIGFSFLHNTRDDNRLAYRINAGVYLLLGVAFTLRALSVLVIDTQASVLEDNPFNQYTYIMATVFNVLIAFSYLLTLYNNNGLSVQRMVDTDLLTGLLNRQALGRDADLLLKRQGARRSVVAALFFEVTPRNLQHGEAEKRVMTHFAEKLLRCFQSNDLIGRIGEREFVVLLPDQNAARAGETAEFLRRTFEDEGSEYEGATVYSQVDFVAIDSALVFTTFEDLVRRARHLRGHSQASMAEQPVTV